MTSSAILRAPSARRVAIRGAQTQQVQIDWLLGCSRWSYRINAATSLPGGEPRHAFGPRAGVDAAERLEALVVPEPRGGK